MRPTEEDELALLLDQHIFMEATGGYIECSCGWPSKEQFQDDEHPAQHIIEAMRTIARLST